jgi:hypothetical protein
MRGKTSVNFIENLVKFLHGSLYEENLDQQLGRALHVNLEFSEG